MLDEDERVVVVSRADLGWKAGVLAVTDRRLLFLYFADVVLELPRAAVRVVRPSRSAWRGNRIVVETAHAAHTFTSVPADRIDELADALRPGAPAS